MSINKLLKSQDINQIVYEVKWHDYLRIWRKERDKERSNDEFHASSLADKNFCLVKAVLNEMMEVKGEVFSPRTLSIFWTGVNVHRKHQKFYRKTGMAYYIEKQHYSEFLDMTFTPDAIINFMNKTIVVEVKSMNTFQFKKLKEPPLKAYWQALIYMYGSGIPQALIIVEDKNDQKIKSYLIQFDVEKAIMLIKRRMDIRKCLEKNMLPLSKRICKKSKIRKRCRFNDICFNRGQLKKILRKNKNENFRG